MAVKIENILHFLKQPLTAYNFPFPTKRVIFAGKVAFMFALAFYLALIADLGYPFVAAASTRSLGISTFRTYGDSVWKGFMRFSGNFLGACLGLLLMAIFPQYALNFFVAASVFIFIFIYIRVSAPSYPYMAYLMFYIPFAMLVIFSTSVDGNVKEVLYYAFERIEEFIIGYSVFLVLAYFWYPSNDVSLDNALKDTQEYQTKTLECIVDQRWEEAATLQKKQRQSISKIYNTLYYAALDSFDVQTHLNAYKNALFHHVKLSRHLMSLTELAKASPEHMKKHQISQKVQTIQELLASMNNSSQPFNASPLASADNTPSLLHVFEEHLNKIYAHGIELKESYEAMHSHSPQRTFKKPPHFRFKLGLNLLDIDALMGATRVFFQFWAVIAIFYLTYDNQNSYLFIAFSMAFFIFLSSKNSYITPGIFLMYNVGVVGGLGIYIFSAYVSTSYPLGLVVFIWAFIVYYTWAKNSLGTVLGLLPLFIMPITDVQSYAFTPYLNGLMQFEMAFVSLMLLQYFPFRNDPHKDLYRTKKRFIKLCAEQMLLHTDFVEGKLSLWNRLRYKHIYAQITQTPLALKKTTAALDYNYFHDISKEALTNYGESVSEYVSLVENLYWSDNFLKKNTLIYSHRRALAFKVAFANAMQQNNPINTEHIEKKITQDKQDYINEYLQGNISLEILVEALKRLDIFLNMHHAMNAMKEKADQIKWESLLKQKF